MTTVPVGKLAGWAALVLTLASLSYAGNFAVDGEPDRNLLYKWSTAIGGTIQYAVVAAIVLAIAWSLAPATVGLRRPRSWARASGQIALSLVAIWALGWVLNLFLKAGDEQGLVPDAWDGSRVWPFVANFVVVAVIAPVAEELTFRGLGFAAVRDTFGAAAAVVVTSLAFGLAHGLVIALPVLTAFGAILALLRLGSESIYPGIVLHCLFNGIALVAAVTVGSGS